MTRDDERADGVPLEDIDELERLEITVDDDPDTTGRSRRAVERASLASTRSGPTNLRIANLETWKLDVDRWRLKLTGLDDGNGRIGRLADDVHELRGDVGDRKECARVRAAADLVDTGRRRVIAAVITAGLALGGAVWAMIRTRDREVAQATIQRMELELRVRNLEQRLEQPRREP